MKERPILFSAPMVRAILDGRKTQTRRVVKNIPWLPDVNPNFSQARPFVNAGRWRMAGSAEMTTDFYCPFGQPGDRLWVRETFGHFERNDQLKAGDEIFYRADGESVDLEPWRPSIHMPRWACRIELEITAVRVERLQDISEADALAEGAFKAPASGRISDSYATMAIAGIWYATATKWFGNLWRQINGEESWDENPWVWVVEFKRVQP